MKFFYGESKEELILRNLLKRLEKGELLTSKELMFIECKLKDGKHRKLWKGVDFLKNGIYKALERVGKSNRTKTSDSEECQNTQE